jgi:tetratricopeptide (TPR) repeat protein
MSRIEWYAKKTILRGIFLCFLVGVWTLLLACSDEVTIGSTVADLQVVHEGVLLDTKDVLQVHRLADGSVVETKPDGRARLRLDDGTNVVVDGSTKFTVTPGQLTLERGRLFVLGGVGARTLIVIGDAVATITGGHAGIERDAKDGKKASVYAASGELVVRAGDKDHPVRTGESAKLEGSGIKVVPERVFDDWTGGMVAPWSATGQARRVVGMLWGGGATVGDPGSPLTLRSQNVSVRVIGESALTQVQSAFFHAGSETVRGDFRMALPPGAIVSGFAAGFGDDLREARMGMADRKGEASGSSPTLEWAGDGWVRGSIQNIDPGTVVQVVVRYAQWLPRRVTDKGVVVEYRFPLASDAEPPIIGEFSAQVDTTVTPPRSIRSGHGATVADGVVMLRKSDFRPTADFVVELELAPEATPARMYVAGADPDDASGSYVLVRTEAPADQSDRGVRLAVVLDTSSSMDAGAFDAARGFLEALVRSMGALDRIAVVGADTTARSLGPDTLGVMDEGRRKAILDALAVAEPAGASDLGVAIEAAADRLDPKDPAGMVVYVGDGWPSVGDLHAREIRARLARRTGGSPRLAAVSVGPRASRFGLAALVRGLGPIFHVDDRSEAAETANLLLGDALQATVGSVRIDLGPDVEQVYPLHGQAVVAGATVFAVGRTRSEAPREVTLRWRSEKGDEEKKLTTHVGRIADGADVRRRWAAARVEELALRSRGREAVTDVALREQLLTPWTGWTLEAGTPPLYRESPVGERVLDLTTGDDALFSAELATPSVVGAALLDLSSDRGSFSGVGDGGYEEAVRMSARRTLDEAVGGIRACRDSRAALRPDLTGVLEVSWKVDGNGGASDVEVKGSPTAYDTALFRCVELVVAGLRFPASGLTTKVSVVHTIQLPPGKPTGRTKCSSTSQLPLPARRGIWEQRLGVQSAGDVYLEAKQQCELRNWSSKRAILELILLRVPGASRVVLARQLEVVGEKDAGDFLRQEALRRARFPEEVRAVRAALLADEGYPVDVFERRYKAATTDAARLGVVRTFLGLAPHDVRLRRELLSLLLAVDDKEGLRQEIARVRRDPFSDATLLADAASALRVLGDEAGALRAFSEIVERAPQDPWARSYAGDRLRREGWYDAAMSMYAPLERAMPSDQPVLLRMALAHAGAGRIDLAGRMLTRLTQTGGRSLDSDLSDLASDLAAILLVTPREGIDKPKQDELMRRAMELPGRPLGTVFLVRSPSASPPISVVMERGPENAREERQPQVNAQVLGMVRLVADTTEEALVLRMTAKEALGPSKPLRVQVDVLVSQGPAQVPVLVSRALELRQDGKKLDLRWGGDRWVD